jgi:hypothetical protein
MQEYKVETFSVRTAENEINVLASEEGWKPILMSTTATSSTNETPISITIIFERVRE